MSWFEKFRLKLEWTLTTRGNASLLILISRTPLLLLFFFFTLFILSFFYFYSSSASSPDDNSWLLSYIGCCTISWSGFLFTWEDIFLLSRDSFSWRSSCCHNFPIQCTISSIIRTLLLNLSLWWEVTYCLFMKWFQISTWRTLNAWKCILLLLLLLYGFSIYGFLIFGVFFLLLSWCISTKWISYFSSGGLSFV